MLASIIGRPNRQIPYRYLFNLFLIVFGLSLPAQAIGVFHLVYGNLTTSDDAVPDNDKVALGP